MPSDFAPFSYHLFSSIILIMTYNQGLEFFRNHLAPEVNAYDETFAEGPEYATGYRIYVMDKDYNRYNISRTAKMPESIEKNVFYWHNKQVAEAYMIHYADANPNLTYGLFPVEVTRGENPWKNNFGQVAKELHITQTAPLKLLTPEMTKEARQNPDLELFSD